MGIRKHLVTLLEESLEREGRELKGSSMAELGNQFIKFSSFHLSKNYFISRGVDHISYDWNGKDDSVMLDLGSSPKQSFPTYDIVTNFGTSEHVYNQYWCFYHIHQLCKVGGIMIHSIPFKNSWPTHCPFYYEPICFELLAESCGYEILHNRIDKSRGPKKHTVTAVLKKKKNVPFVPLVDNSIFINTFKITKEDE